MSPSCTIDVRFHPPPAELRRYFTTFYLVEAEVAGSDFCHDYLHPEWGNLRFYSGAAPRAETVTGMTLSDTHFAATGPSSTAVRFAMGNSRMWGIGLLPLGWAKFVGAPADELANAAVDGHRHPAFASFASLARQIYSDAPDEQTELERITAHFCDRRHEHVPDEERILKIHSALVDPEVQTVADLVEQTGISQHTVARVCNRAFGFPPKLLLRRQRFMRSLAQFMLDPSLKWIGAIDGQYHDQAQFVRDFRQFMGMTPRQYATLEKPIISAIVQARARFAGAAVQALDSPDGAAI